MAKRGIARHSAAGLWACRLYPWQASERPWPLHPRAPRCTAPPPPNNSLQSWASPACEGKRMSQPSPLSHAAQPRTGLGSGPAREPPGAASRYVRTSWERELRTAMRRVVTPLPLPGGLGVGPPAAAAAAAAAPSSPGVGMITPAPVPAPPAPEPPRLLVGDLAGERSGEDCSAERSGTGPALLGGSCTSCTAADRPCRQRGG